MTTEDRKQKIELYGNAYNMLTKALQEFPREIWHFKPSPDDWSVHERIFQVINV